MHRLQKCHSDPCHKFFHYRLILKSIQVKLSRVSLVKKVLDSVSFRQHFPTSNNFEKHSNKSVTSQILSHSDNFLHHRLILKSIQMRVLRLSLVKSLSNNFLHHRLILKSIQIPSSAPVSRRSLRTCHNFFHYQLILKSSQTRLILKNLKISSSAPVSRRSPRTAENRQSSEKTLPEFSANLAIIVPADRGKAATS